MNDGEWNVFAAECEASFRGDLAEDREAVLREYLGAAGFDEAREAVRLLVRDGQVMVPAPAELLDALAAVRRARPRPALEGPVVEVGALWRSHRAHLAQHPPIKGDGQDAECPGALRVFLDDGKGPVLVACDKCGAELGVGRGTPAGSDEPLAGGGDDEEEEAVF